MWSSPNRGALSVQVAAHLRAGLGRRPEQAIMMLLRIRVCCQFKLLRISVHDSAVAQNRQYKLIMLMVRRGVVGGLPSPPHVLV